jgi:hypothetical protein
MTVTFRNIHRVWLCVCMFVHNVYCFPFKDIAFAPEMKRKQTEKDWTKCICWAGWFLLHILPGPKQSGGNGMSSILSFGRVINHTVYKCNETNIIKWTGNREMRKKVKKKRIKKLPEMYQKTRKFNSNLIDPLGWVSKFN